MYQATLNKIDELRTRILETEAPEKLEAPEVDATVLERLNYRLSDAIREGSSVTDMAHGWGTGNEACALHSAVIAAKARGYIGS